MNPFEGQGFFPEQLQDADNGYNNFILAAVAIDSIADKAEKKRYEKSIANLRTMFPSSKNIDTQKANIEKVRQRTDEYKAKLESSRKAAEKRVNSREFNAGNFRINEMNKELEALIANEPPPAQKPVQDVPLPAELKAENQPKETPKGTTPAPDSPNQGGQEMPLNAKSSNTQKILLYAAIVVGAIVVIKLVKK